MERRAGFVRVVPVIHLSVCECVEHQRDGRRFHAKTRSASLHTPFSPVACGTKLVHRAAERFASFRCEIKVLLDMTWVRAGLSECPRKREGIQFPPVLQLHKYFQVVFALHLFQPI